MTMSSPARAAVGISSTSPANGMVNNRIQTPCIIAEARDLAPALTFVELRTITPVTGSPPMVPDTMLAAPCPTSSRLKSVRGPWCIRSTDTADSKLSTLAMSGLAAPLMCEGGGGRIINLSSIVGLLGRSGVATYSASKAYVVSFTEGLAVGLRGTGVGIHVVCPGYVHTEFHDRAGIDMTSLPSFMWLEVDDVVRETLSEAARGTVVIIPGLQYKAITTVSRMVPRTLSRAATSVFGRGRGRT